MPGDGYITKSNKELLQSDGPGKLQEGQELNQQQNQQQPMIAEEKQEEYRKMTTQQKNLQKSKRTSWWSNTDIEDSDEMKNVKAAMQELTNFYLDNEVPADEETYKNQLDRLGNLYTKLIQSCDVYVNARDTFFTIFKSRQGNERLSMVKEIRVKSKVEYARYVGRSKKVFESCKNLPEEQERPLWINVLAEVRTEYIDLRNIPEDKVSYMGGNTSSVIRLQTEDGKVGFIKENEYNVKPYHENLQERYKQNFKELNEYKKAKKNLNLTDDQLGKLLDFLMREYSKGIMDSVFDDKEIGAESFDELDTQLLILGTLLRKKGQELNNIIEEVSLNSDEVRALIAHYSKYYFRHKLGNQIAGGNARITEGYNITARNVLNYRLAELLGLTNLIPASRNVQYKDRKGNDHKGVIMAEAKGKELWEIAKQEKEKQNDERLVCNDKFYLQMNSLQIMDLIAGQVDRHMRNIMVDYDEEKNEIKSIQGIDNDMSFGTVEYWDVQQKKSIKSIEKDEKLVLSFIDKSLYTRILSLSDEMLEYTFYDVLTMYEMAALKDRVHGVQRLLKTIPESVLINPEDLHVDYVKTMEGQENCYTNMLKFFRIQTKESPRLKAERLKREKEAKKDELQ